MPYLSGAIEKSGAVVDAVIGVPQFRVAMLQRLSMPVPPPVHVRASLDTGSFLSGFHPGVFRLLNLQPHDEIEICTPSTPIGTFFRVERYRVNLSLVAEGRTCPMPDCFVFSTDSWRPGEGVEALIGMDILSRCYFQLLGPDRRFTLAF